MKIKKQQTLDIVRSVLSAVGSVLIVLGVSEPEQTDTIINNVEIVSGVLFTIGSLFWSVKSEDKK